MSNCVFAFARPKKQGMARPRIESFEEFWPFYLNEHRKPLTRTLHFIGSTLGVFVFIAAFAWGAPAFAPLGLLPGYGFAWFSHFVIEKNKPASFTYPLWSFIADWKMWALMLTGRIGSEVSRHVTT
jgi:hypothetical protein